MKTGFYSKLALSNIRKNYRFFIPRMITEAGLLGCFFIVLTLKTDHRLATVSGGEYLPFFMMIGTAVMALLSTVLIFYTNSFLMKQRKREFGLYNILGMEKRHVGRVLFCETFFCSMISIIFGLCLGVLFYKCCALMICKLLKTNVIFGFYFLKAKPIIISAVFFAALDLLTCLFNRISIAKMKPVELLKSKATGEKEPKVKWVMLVLGLLFLGGGYYISVTTTSPLKALYLFFLAVILVILGTYFLFVAGSIFVLKALQKSKKFYYHKNRMPSVSGLLYRMKQNAVGLASIAILATGVLVMISTTVSLYSGMQEILDDHYPQQLYLSAGYTENGKLTEIETPALQNMVQNAADRQNLTVKSMEEQRYLTDSFLVQGGKLLGQTDVGNDVDYDKLCYFTFISADVYNKLSNTNLSLADDEIAVCRITSQMGDIRELPNQISLKNLTFNKKTNLTSFPINDASVSVVSSYGIVVANDTVLDYIYNTQKQMYGLNASEYSHRIAVRYNNPAKAMDAGDKMTAQIKNDLNDYVAQKTNGGKLSYSLDTVWEAKSSVLGMYGTLLFLGILLGFVCLFATILIIYYKQISEGYEDRERFQIMKKIGMSEKEVQKTIRTQILFVFFLPLLIAGVHVCFAFPILLRLLSILMLTDTLLFIICTAAVFVVFSLIYLIIYLCTAKTYYKIIQ